jgi:hypothetical protein
LSALNMENHFFFVSNFKHVNFAMNEKYSKNNCGNPNYYCFPSDFSNIQKCNFKKCQVTWVPPFTVI